MTVVGVTCAAQSNSSIASIPCAPAASGRHLKGFNELPHIRDQAPIGNDQAWLCTTDLTKIKSPPPDGRNNVTIMEPNRGELTWN
jgi:hypothetical protein